MLTSVECVIGVLCHSVPDLSSDLPKGRNWSTVLCTVQTTGQESR